MPMLPRAAAWVAWAVWICRVSSWREKPRHDISTERLHMVIHTDMAHAFQAPPAAPQPGESTSFEASASELRALVAAVPQFLWVYDFDGHCTFSSEQWMRYPGTAAGSQLGYGWLECVHPEERSALRERWSRAIATGMALDIEMRVRAADGRYRWFKHRAVPQEPQAEGPMTVSPALQCTNALFVSRPALRYFDCSGVRIP